MCIWNYLWWRPFYLIAVVYLLQNEHTLGKQNFAGGFAFMDQIMDNFFLFLDLKSYSLKSYSLSSPVFCFPKEGKVFIFSSLLFPLRQSVSIYIMFCMLLLKPVGHLSYELKRE